MKRRNLTKTAHGEQGPTESGPIGSVGSDCRGRPRLNVCEAGPVASAPRIPYALRMPDPIRAVPPLGRTARVGRRRRHPEVAANWLLVSRGIPSGTPRRRENGGGLPADAAVCLGC